jgi:hypothetical protein
MTEQQDVVVTGTPVDSRRQKPEQPMSTYKLREGARHYMDGELVGAEEEISLTDSEYIAFGDKFVPTGKTSTKRRTGKLPAGVEDVDVPRAGDENLNPPLVRARGVDHLPQDIGAKTPDLGAPQANPGNATRSRGASVSAESLQSLGEQDKAEAKKGFDGPVASGQIPPERNVAAATVAGGVATAVKQQTEPAKKEK